MPAGLPQPDAADIQPYHWRGYGGQYGLVDRMQFSDGLVRTVVATRVQGVLDLSLRVSPASEDPADVEVADWLRSALFDRFGWRRWLTTAAQFSARGAVYYEPEFKRDADKRWHIAAMHIVPMRTVMRWERAPEGYRLVQYVMQSAYDVQDRLEVTLPPDRLLGLRYMPEGDDPEPYGWLRSAYGAWYRRGRAMGQWADALDVAAYGVPSIFPVEGVPRDPDQGVELSKRLMVSRSDPNEVLVRPEGWDYEFKSRPIDTAGMQGIVDTDKREIARVAACQHLLTGEDNGTEALLREQIARIYRPACLADAEVILEALRPVLSQMVALSWGREMPQLSWDPPSDASLVERMTALREMLAAGVVVDDDRSIERLVRDVLDLPDLSDLSDDEAEDDAGESMEQPIAVESAPEVPEDVAEVEDQPEEPTAALSDYVPPMVAARVSGDVLVVGPAGRQLADAERVLRLSETVVPARRAKDEAGAIIDAWLAAIAPAYAEAVAREAEAFPTLDAVAESSVPGVADLEAALDALMGEVYDAGKASASAETRRIRRNPDAVAEVVSGDVEALRDGCAVAACKCGKAHGSGWLVQALADVEQPPPGDVAAASPVSRLSARQIIARWVSDLARSQVQRVEGAVRRVLGALGPAGTTSGVPFADVFAAVRDAIVGLSPRESATAAQGAVNTIFGLGRVQQQEAVAQPGDVWLYTTALESERCEPCIEHDLTVVPADRLVEYQTPASWCEGQDRCNCLLILVPASDVPPGARRA